MSLEEIQARMNKLNKSQMIDSSISNLSLEEIFLKKASLATTRISDFDKNLDWFNSQPLSFENELKGKFVILDFWTYCCMNCIHVLPDLKYLEEKYKENKSVVFIGVHSAKFENEKLSENILNAILRYDIKHPVVNDFEMKMWKEMKISCWPTFVLINPDGKFVKKFVGEGNRQDLEKLIDEAIKFHKNELSNEVVIKFKSHSKNNFLNYPSNIIHHNGLFFISDSSNNRIIVTKMTDEKQFEILYQIGSGKCGFKDGSFDQCEFNHLHGLLGVDDFIYVADTDNHSIRKIDLKKKIASTEIGNGKQGNLDALSEGQGNEISLNSPWELCGSGEQIFVSMSGSHQIWKIKNQFAKNIVGNSEELHKNGENPLEVSLAQPSGIFIDENEILYFTDSESSSIRQVDLNSMKTTTIAGGDENNPKNLFDYGDIVGSLKNAKFQHPLGVLKWNGKLIITDTYNHKIKMVDGDNVVNLAGTGSAGYFDSDNFSAIQFNEPTGIFELNNILFVADTNNHSIRCLDLENKTSWTIQFVKSTKELDGKIISIGQIYGKDGEILQFKIIVKLPKGCHLHDTAPSRWKFGSLKGKIEPYESNSCILQVECDFTLEIIIKCQIYYCSNELCLMKDLSFKIDAHVGEQKPMVFYHSFDE